MDMDYAFGYLKLFASGGAVEYTEFAGATPSWTKSYTYLGDSVLSTESKNGTSQTVEYNHPDRLGTKIVTNQAVGTSYEQNSLPFGTTISGETTATALNKKFTSYERSSSTGLDYAINRTYDSKQGRFTQVDPIGMSAASLGSPQTLNLYTYCGNDPINHTDPSGLFFGSLFKWIGKIFRAVNKILKWVVIAVVVITVAIAVFHSGGAAAVFLTKLMGIVGKIAGFAAKAGSAIITNFAAGIGISIEGSISVSTTGSILSGLYAVGAVASRFAQTDDKKRKAGPKTVSFCSQVEPYIKAAKTFFDDAWKRSNYKGVKPIEQGGIVNLNGGRLNNVKFQRKPNSSSYQLEGFDEFLTNNINSKTTIFWYHTHPFDKGDVLEVLSDGRQKVALDQNFPSEPDRDVSRGTNLYGIAITSTSIAVFNAKGRRCRFDR